MSNMPNFMLKIPHYLKQKKRTTFSLTIITLKHHAVMTQTRSQTKELKTKYYNL